MRRSGPIARKTSLKSSGRIKPKRKPKAQTDAKFAREFGSAERVAWVASQPCVCGCGRSPCENHHIVTAGMGLRAHHSLIVPLAPECHREFHRIGRHSWEAKYRVTLAVEAERIHKTFYQLQTGHAWHEATE